MEKIIVMQKPTKKPDSFRFGIGPTKKFVAWKKIIETSWLGRSHRAKDTVEHIAYIIDKFHATLNLPKDYELYFVPGSATSAVETIMWNLFGYVGVDFWIWDTFSALWATEGKKQLKLPTMTIQGDSTGRIIPSLEYTPGRDVLFAWNGSTTGLTVLPTQLPKVSGEGLLITDVTSAIGGTPIAYEKLDVLAFSFQKLFSGEAGVGVIVLSPKAKERIKKYNAPWPIPRNMNLPVITQFNKGEYVNTPSLMIFEDLLHVLDTVDSHGGLPWLIKRSHNNKVVIDEWIKNTPWIENNAINPAEASQTTMALRLLDKKGAILSIELRDRILQLLWDEGVAKDLKGHRTNPNVSIRIFVGASIEAEDLRRLTQWLEWAYSTVIG